MTRRTRAVVCAVALAVAACSAEPELTRSASPAERPTTTDTSVGDGATTSTVPPTTAAAPTTTPPTTAPAPPLPSPAADGQARALLTTTGVVAAVLGVDGGAYRIRTPCGGEAVVSTGTPITGATVVLDPGHGGEEPGAVGANGLTEKALNLSVAERAKGALEARGATVVLTRTGDYRMTLGARAEVAKALAPGAFVSVHHNGGGDGPTERPGTETYFQIGSAESRRLAGLVYEELLATFSSYDGIAWVGDTDAGAKFRPNGSGGDYYGILRQSAGVTAVLSEAAFLSNPPEAELLARPEVQQAEGEALARAIGRHLTTDDPGSGFTEPYPRTDPAGPGGGSSGCIDPPLS